MLKPQVCMYVKHAMIEMSDPMLDQTHEITETILVNELIIALFEILVATKIKPDISVVKRKIDVIHLLKKFFVLSKNLVKTELLLRTDELAILLKVMNEKHVKNDDLLNNLAVMLFAQHHVLNQHEVNIFVPIVEIQMKRDENPLLETTHHLLIEIDLQRVLNELIPVIVESLE